MKRLFIIPIALSSFLFSCSDNQKASLSTTINQFTNDSLTNNQWNSYKEGFLNSFWALHPEWATEMGNHNYDTLLSIKDSNYYARLESFWTTQIDSLQSLDTLKLSYDNYIDFCLIKNELNKIKYQHLSLKTDSWNPARYNVFGALSHMITETYAPLNDRLKAISHRIKQVPAYYKSAEKNIQNAVPELAQLAIDQNRGGLTILSSALIDSVMKSSLSSFEKSDILEHNQIAIRAIKDYIKFLEKNLPNYNRSFRIGAEAYEELFKMEIQSPYSAKDMYEKANKRVQFIHNEMYKISDTLWSKYFPQISKPTDTLVLIRQILDTIAAHHVAPDSFQYAINKQIPELEQFVNDNHLLYLDPEKPLVVRPEPGHLVGIAGASISAPGPYDTLGNTYYNVGSFKGWSDDKIESYLREYNNYTLQILNIHEAIPGHYTQLVYANKAPSMIKSIFGNNAFIEGWAVYSEQMMLENGYGNNQPEMWLMWYKWNLRTVFNMIIDYEIHTQNLSKEATIEKLTKSAFQEQTEAVNKWSRATVTHIQLTSYYTGYEEIIELRDLYKKSKGINYSLKTFHEALLSHGSIPIRYIAPIILN